MDSKLLRLACLCSLVYDDDDRICKILHSLSEFSDVKCFNSHHSQCFVCVDHRLESCVIIFRGTDDIIDTVRDLRFFPMRNTGRSSSGYVHRGFCKSLDCIYDDVFNYVNELKAAYKNINVICTGHSLGAAMATIMAYNISANELYTFGSPRVGTKGFKRDLDASGIKHTRVVNGNDIVTTVPTSCIYSHHGSLLQMDKCQHFGVTSHLICNYIKNIQESCADKYETLSRLVSKCITKI